MKYFYIFAFILAFLLVILFGIFPPPVGLRYEFLSDHFSQIYFIPKSTNLLNKFFDFGWVLAIPLLLVPFLLPYSRVKSKLSKVLLATFFMYIFLLYINFFIGVSCNNTSYRDPCTGRNINLEYWLGYMGFGWGMFVIPLAFMFLNGTLFFSKKSLGEERPLIRFANGAGLAFVLWMFFAFILLFFGFQAVD